jgi:uncharacterized membrane protein
MALLSFGALWWVYQAVLPSLPERVPTHFDLAGNPNGWTPKAALPWVVFGLPFFIWFLTWAVSVVTARLQEDPAKARATAMAPMRGFLGLGLAGAMAGMLLTPSQGTWALNAGIGALLVFLTAGIVLMIRDFKKLPRNATSLEHYKWGLFYVNPDDPRLVVEKAIGIGWTLNFAKPLSWFIMAVVLLPLALLAMGKLGR